jgi:hypothetical protein
VKSVKIYVEGVSDKTAMMALLRPLIATKAAQGITIEFFEAPSGDKKACVIRKVPVQAALILKNDPNAIVVAMPDLYPLNKEVHHETPQELFAAIQAKFKKALKQFRMDDDARFLDRLKVFCFKYELEALLLAAEDALALCLEVDRLNTSWIVPVEDQNKDHPPKEIVQQLYAAREKKYVEAVDAPLILGLATYSEIAAACPQCFMPFIEFLEQLS